VLFELMGKSGVVVMPAVPQLYVAPVVVEVLTLLGLTEPSCDRPGDAK
jgi:hypothetical protein